MLHQESHTPPSPSPCTVCPPHHSDRYFAGVFADNAVLQRDGPNGTTRAALYGASYGVGSATTVTVTVTDGASAPATYTASIVDRATDPITQVANLTWKVYLPPHGYGGNATISAVCSACKNTTAAVIRNVQWGDVWVCSGQVGIHCLTHLAFNAMQSTSACRCG